MRIAVDIGAIQKLANDMTGYKRKLDTIIGEFKSLARNLEWDIGNADHQVRILLNDAEKELEELALLYGRHINFLWDARAEYNRLENDVLKMVSDLETLEEFDVSGQGIVGNVVHVEGIEHIGAKKSSAIEGMELNQPYIGDPYQQSIEYENFGNERAAFEDITLPDPIVGNPHGVESIEHKSFEAEKNKFEGISLEEPIVGNLIAPEAGTIGGYEEISTESQHIIGNRPMIEKMVLDKKLINITPIVGNPVKVKTIHYQAIAEEKDMIIESWLKKI